MLFRELLLRARDTSMGQGQACTRAADIRGQLRQLTIAMEKHGCGLGDDIPIELFQVADRDRLPCGVCDECKQYAEEEGVTNWRDFVEKEDGLYNA